MSHFAGLSVESSTEDSTPRDSGPPAGCEWVVEAHGCDGERLRQVPALQTFFESVVSGMDLHPVAAAVWHQFPGSGGITGFQMLAESHLACHTFPEYGSICLNLFCCRPRPEWDFAGEMGRAFAAGEVVVRRIERPYARPGARP